MEEADLCDPDASGDISRDDGILSRQLHVISDQFRLDLPEQITELLEAWKNLRSAVERETALSANNAASTSFIPDFHESVSPSQSIPLWSTLVRQVHSLAGSSGSLGFFGIAEQARFCQRALETAAGAPSDRRALDLVGQRLQALSAAAVECCQIDLNELTLRLGAAKTTTSSMEDQRRRRVVFLVEDDPVQSRDLAAQIGFFGYKVRVFPSPSGLEEAVLNDMPTVILMDVIFPEGGNAGIEAIVRLGAQGSVPPPVIFITRDESMSTRLQAVRAGGKAFFVKPVDVDSLVDAIDRLSFQEDDRPARILIVDDSRVQATFAAMQLRKAGMIAQILMDPMELITHIISFDPDLVLMDMYMPECTGTELATVIRQMDRFVGLPIVFLSGETDRETQLAALGIGADDFLTKPIQPSHLISSVTTKVDRYRQMRSRMVRDGLTGLLNHKSIMEKLAREVDRCRFMEDSSPDSGMGTAAISGIRPSGDQAQLCFAMLDLDDFKTVNDRFGHSTGDRVLRSLAHMLKQRLRESDLVGRYGGEEFAVVMPATSEAEGLRLMSEVAASFASIRHRSADGEFTVTFSCGVAGLQEGGTAATLLEVADATLYVAKGAGRNRVLRGCS